MVVNWATMDYKQLKFYGSVKTVKEKIMKIYFLVNLYSQDCT